MKTVLKKSSLSAAAGMALCFALLPAQQAHATAFVPCNDIQALKDAITDSNTTGERINLAAGCTYTLTAADNDQNGLPVITGNVRISSQGATIRRSPAATDEFRIFQVDGSGSLSLTSVTVSGGRLGTATDDSGAGILNEGSTTLTSATVSDNRAGFGGGGIHNDGGQLSLTRTVIENNRATNGDLGGGIWNDAATLTMSGGALRNNISDSDGAGLENWPQSTATISGATVSGNTSTQGNGGGIDNDSVSTLNLTSTTVSGNRATGGGGLRNRSSTAALVGGQVTGNTATGGPGSGGGILQQGTGGVSLNGTVVANNTPDNCAPDGVIVGCTNPTATTSTGRTPQPESPGTKGHHLNKQLRHAHAS
ncbi:right-handed parallel beta-helix repeat-containing protein [Streptomyces winkii]|uniref:right-handed parallel beta-helix repeat-containing protein n=1 Tax=Streptomyces winkii TaxID=3051178 RepID=UPI0028D7A33D|nr:right-handed parallel beta-helix repeat-containing protein [Streptomyces sp. DSM 40971]